MTYSWIRIVHFDWYGFFFFNIVILHVTLQHHVSSPCAASDAADEAVGGTELQIDVKLIGPEGGKAAVTAQKKNKKKTRRHICQWLARTDDSSCGGCRVYRWFVSQSHDFLPRRAGQRPASHTTHPLDIYSKTTTKISFIFMYVALILITFQSSQLTSLHPPLSLSNLHWKRKKKSNLHFLFFVNIFKLAFISPFFKWTLHWNVKYT